MNFINLSTLAIICLVFTLKALGDQNCVTRKGFKNGTSFEVKHVQRKSKIDVTKAQIIWDPQIMLDTTTCYDVASAQLEYIQHKAKKVDGRGIEENKQENRWRIVASEVKGHGKRMQWTVDVIPCLEYQFRIVVNGTEAAIPYYSGAEILGRASNNSVLNSKYIPKDPKFLREITRDTGATLVFESSHCVDTYDISIKEESGESAEEFKIINESTNQGISTNDTLYIPILGLKSCTNYEVSLYAVIGHKYSEGESPQSFSTKPNLNSSSEIKLTHLNIGNNDVSFSIDSPWNSGLSCFHQYRFEVCSDSKFEANFKCLDPITKKENRNNINFQTTIEGLDPCQYYELRITPIFKGIKIHTKSFPFKTLVDEEQKPKCVKATSIMPKELSGNPN